MRTIIDELLFSKQIIRAKNTHVKVLTDTLGKQKYDGLIEYRAWSSPVEGDEILRPSAEGLRMTKGEGLAMTSGVKGDEYEAEEIATGFALATTSSDCRVLLLKDSQ